MCGVWLTLSFPYLHSIWHVLIAFAGYHAVVFFAYRHTEQQFADLKPFLSFFPSDDWPRVGLAYITLKNPQPAYKVKNVCHIC